MKIWRMRARFQESLSKVKDSCSVGGGLGVAAASGEACSTQGLLEVWQSSQGLGRLEEVGRVVVFSHSQTELKGVH